MKLNLWIHEGEEIEDLLVNGEILGELRGQDFPGGLKEGDFLEITQTEGKGQAGSPGSSSVVLQVASLKKLTQQRAQISVSK